MILPTVLGLMAAQAAPIAPPLPQSLADCTHPVYATDQLVCSDPQLRVLDQSLAELLTDYRLDEQLEPGLEDQQAWFRRSRMCAFQKDHVGCVGEAYRDRIAILKALSTPLTAPAIPCTPPSGPLTASMSRGYLVLRKSSRAVAVASPKGGTWRPFLIITQSRGRLAVRDLSNRLVATCKSIVQPTDR